MKGDEMKHNINIKNLLLGALLAASLVVSIGAATTVAGRTAWEYKTISPANVADDELNKIGSEGWELVNFTFIPHGETHHDDYSRYVFKRRASTR
jgi:hypothetical protein